MKKLKKLNNAIIAVVVLLGICLFVWFISANIPHAMTNEQIVEQTKFCRDNGMDSERLQSGLTYETIQITCVDEGGEE